MDTKQRRRIQRGIDRIFYAGGDGIRSVPMLRGGAGSYPDVPSRRMAHDADGTEFIYVRTNNSIVAADNSDHVEFNGENPNLGRDLVVLLGSAVHGMTTIFPELREVDGFHGRINRNNNTPNEVETSGDTTNGRDGTWTSRIASYSATLDTGNIDEYRDSITSLAVSNVRGLRWRKDFHGLAGRTETLRLFHVYGEISSGETPDRLLWIDNDDDLEFSLPIDYGDVPRGSASDHVVYLTNNSASLSAGSVQVTAESLYLGSGSWYTFDDGTGFSSTKSLASSIANGANSPDITIRRIIPDAETLGLHAARAFVSVGSWT